MNRIEEVLRTRFSGVISKGAHAPNGIACALELLSQARGLKWTDSPQKLSVWDIRPLNDGPWSSNFTRTKHLLPLLVALDTHVCGVDSAKSIALRTIREILPLALDAVGLDSSTCRNAEDLRLAEWAAEAAAARTAEAAEARAKAAWAAAAEAAWAAAAVRAAEVAEAAAGAARAAAAAAAAGVTAGVAESILILACSIWTEEINRGGAKV